MSNGKPRTDDEVTELITDLIEELGKNERGQLVPLPAYLSALRTAKEQINDSISAALGDMKRAGIEDDGG